MTILSIPPTNNVADPEARKILDALRIAVETLVGRQGAITDQAVTKGQLNSVGLIGLNGAAIYNPATKTTTTTAPTPTAPPAPANVTVQRTTSTLAILTWSVPDFTTGIDHAEVWQVTVTAFSDATNYAVDDVVSYDGAYYQFINAHVAGPWVAGDVKTVTSSSFSYSDADTITECAFSRAMIPLDISGAIFFWVRLVSTDKIAGPFSDQHSATAASAGTLEHNTLRGLQGGTTDQYYHLTAAQSALFTAGTAHQVLHGDSTTPTWGAVDLSADITGNLPVTCLNGGIGASNTSYWRGDGSWGVPAGTGVTAISVASANGLAGTSSGGTTPQLTLSTAVSGIVKGNGSAFGSATDGSDYLSPSTGVTLSQPTGQTIGSTSNRLTALWVTDVTCTHAINASITGNAATATVASSCSGNAATATVASSCSGNAATATTASACSGNSATVTGLSVASGKTLTVNNSVTLAGTDGTTITFPAATCTLARKDADNNFSTGQTIFGTLAVTGNTTLCDSNTGTKNLQIGGYSLADNSSIRFILVSSNTVNNWQVATNWNYAGCFELMPSTVAGGSVFSSTVFHVDPTGNAYMNGLVSVGGTQVTIGAVTTTGNKSLKIGTSPTDNSSSYLYLLGSNSVTNWRIATNQIHAGGFELQPSTLGGGSTFSASVFYLDPSGNIVISGALTLNSATLLATNTTLTNGAGSSTGTLTNAPAAGNPTKWIAINDNGTTRYIPAW